METNKGWFPYDRRRSQTIADRKSQIADDRKAKETSVLSSQNIHEETKTWGFPHTAERTSCFYRTVTNINEHSGFVAKKF